MNMTEPPQAALTEEGVHTGDTSNDNLSWPGRADCRLLLSSQPGSVLNKTNTNLVRKNQEDSSFVPSVKACQYRH